MIDFSQVRVGISFTHPLYGQQRISSFCRARGSEWEKCNKADATHVSGYAVCGSLFTLAAFCAEANFESDLGDEMRGYEGYEPDGITLEKPKPAAPKDPKDMSYDEFVEHRQAQEALVHVNSGKFQAGALVNLQGWFGDVWAEVLEANINKEDPGRFSYILIVQYGKHGQERWISMEYATRIRQVAANVEEAKALGGVSVLYTSDTYQSACYPTVKWPTPLSKDSHSNRHRREAFPG